MASDTPRPSKTQKKKLMLSLQDLGAELVTLNDPQLASIELPEGLRDAIIDARGMRKFEARRRQLQYIGRLMRDIDPEPIQARLDGWKASSREHTARLHRIERWRERLIGDDTALGEFIAAHPDADAERLRMLIRGCRAESADNRPPRSFRALFQLIRDTTEANTSTIKEHDNAQR
jgi:ribosome-associated protein